MIDLERRLQHAARELREVHIDPPPLDSLRQAQRPSGLVMRLPALVMPVLFVLGGLAVVAGGLARQDVAEPPVPVTLETPEQAPPEEQAADDRPVLTARQEIALITSLRPVTTDDGSTATTPTSADVRSLLRRYQ